MARKAEAYLKTTGIADTSYSGPECEFYIFNDIRFHQDSRSGYYFIDSEEGIWNSGQGGVTPSAPARRAQPGLPAAATRRATSPSRRWTSCRTCAAG